MVNYNYLLKYLFVYQTHTHDSCLPSQNNLLRMLPIFFASLTKRLTEQVKESSLYSTSHGGVQSILAASTGTTFYKSTSCNKQKQIMLAFNLRSPFYSGRDPTPLSSTTPIYERTSDVS